MNARAPRHDLTLLLCLLSILIAVAYAQIMQHYTGGQWILPLDDTYIYLHYARHLAEGHLLQYNIGDPASTGATSYLYLAILAIGAKIGLGEALVVLPFVLNAAFLLATAMILFRLLRPTLGADVAAAAALLTVVTGPVSAGYLCGMDIGLTVVAILLTISALDRDLRDASAPSWRAPVALSLLVVARPEGLVFACGLSAVLLVLTSLVPVRRRVRFVIPLMVALAEIGFNYALTGHATPNSSHPKSVFNTLYFSPLFILQHAANYYIFVIKGLLAGTYTVDLLAPLNRIDTLAFAPPFALIAYCVGAGYHVAEEIRLRRLGSHTLLNAWFICGVLFIGLVNGGGAHHFRYLMPFFFVFLVYLIPGVMLLLRAFGRAIDAPAPTTRMLAMAGSCLVCCFQLLVAANSLLLYGQTAYGFVVFRDAARWVAANTRADDIVAALDVGYIAYYSNRRVLDLYGLTSNEMTASTFYFGDVLGSKWELIERMPPERRPRYFFGHRQRFEEHGDDGHFDPLRQQRVFVARPTAPFFPAIGTDLSLWALDWSEVGVANTVRSSALRARVANMQLVTRLDVADLESHRDNSYQFIPAVTGVFPSNRVLRARDSDGNLLTDPLWGIAGSERFRVDLSTPSSLLLILRTNFLRPPVTVAVNGRLVGAFVVSTRADEWTEEAIEIPAAAVHAGANEVEVSGTHTSAHYWIYRATSAP